MPTKIHGDQVAQDQLGDFHIDPSDPVTEASIKLTFPTHINVNSVISRSYNSPPTLNIGDRYIIGYAPTGDWKGHPGDIAEYTETGWIFITPVRGTITYITDEGFTFIQVNSVLPWIWTQALIQCDDTITQATIKSLTDGSIIDIHRHQFLSEYQITGGFSQIVNGVHNILGIREQVITDQNISPTNSEDMIRMGGMLSLFNVTTVTAVGTLRITGTSYNPMTGVDIPGDTDDIIIDSTGFYMSIKLWKGTITLSSVNGLNIVLAGYRFTPYGIFNPNSDLRDLIWTCRSIDAFASVTVAIYIFDPDTKLFSQIYSESHSFSAGGISAGRYRLWGVNGARFEFPNGHYLLMTLSTVAIEDFQYQMRFVSI